MSKVTVDPLVMLGCQVLVLASLSFALKAPPTLQLLLNTLSVLAAAYMLSIQVTGGFSRFYPLATIRVTVLALAVILLLAQIVR